MDNDPLAAAIEHARAFAQSLNPDDSIDGKTGFTVDNLLALIAAATPPTPEDKVADELGDPA
ncbi:hypothetical protein ASG07_08185 [Sphingomonas sp. Leaf343]|nr:hypothetical protein ASG07_08185 [Sphingomonas sp. Leaf343]